MTAHSRSNPAAFIASLIALVMTGAILVLTLLKETPIFWRNEGGYAIWFRNWMEVSYYPVLFLVMSVCICTTAGEVRHAIKGRFSSSHWLHLGVTWILLAASISLLVANNLSNLLHGNPLHWHPQ